MPATALPSPHPSAPSTCHGRWMSPEYEPGLVSVIVPTYNRAHLIVETLDSVFAQTYRPLELLIVDDGSTDNTADVVRQWEQDHQQDGFTIRFMSQENRGAPAARNLGLIESRGEFIQFLDSDDLIHPEKLKIQVNAFTSGDYAWSDCALFHYSVDWPGASERIVAIDPSVHELLRKGGLNTIVGIYRRSTCVDLGPWNEELRISQDGEYNIRLLLTKRHIVRVPGVLSAFRIEHGRRISGHFRGNEMLVSLQRYEYLLRHFNELTPKNCEALSIRCQSIAVLALSNSQADVARKWLRHGRRLCTTRSRHTKLIAVQAMSYLPEYISTFIMKQLLAFYKQRRSWRAYQRKSSHAPPAKV